MFGHLEQTLTQRLSSHFCNVLKPKAVIKTQLMCNTHLELIEPLSESVKKTLNISSI